MLDTIMRNNDALDDIINAVIAVEWQMFDQVQGLNGRASCQDDAKGFYIMRYAQHRAFGQAVIQSYFKDVVQAQAVGRNLVMEKYALMMKATDADYFKTHLAATLPECPPMKRQLIAAIRQLLMAQQQQVFAAYPKLAARGRVAEDGAGETSAATYLAAELETYSMSTLRLCLEAVQQKAHLLQHIYEQTAAFYGQTLAEYR